MAELRWQQSLHHGSPQFHALSPRAQFQQSLLFWSCLDPTTRQTGPSSWQCSQLQESEPLSKSTISETRSDLLQTESCKFFFPMSVSQSKQDRKGRSCHSNMKRSGKVQYDNFSKNNCFVPTQAKIFCTALPSPDQRICNANQLLSSICTTIITWKNLFNIRRLIGADEWLWHDIHGIEIQLKTASGTEVLVIVQHVPWDLCWNTAISCTGWEILGFFNGNLLPYRKLN